MQYSRVLLVALAAALVARFWAGTGGAHTSSAQWLATVHWGPLTMTVLLAVLGQQAARMLRLQAWAVLNLDATIRAKLAGNMNTACSAESSSIGTEGLQA